MSERRWTLDEIWDAFTFTRNDDFASLRRQLEALPAPGLDGEQLPKCFTNSQADIRDMLERDNMQKRIAELESENAEAPWTTDEMEIVAYEADHCAQERGLRLGADAFFNVRFGFIEGAKWMARRRFERTKK